LKSFHPMHYGIPTVVYLTLQPVFHTQLFQGMWLLEVGTLALFSCLPDRLRFTRNTYRRRVFFFFIFVCLFLSLRIAV